MAKKICMSLIGICLLMSSFSLWNSLLSWSQLASGSISADLKNYMWKIKDTKFTSTESLPNFGKTFGNNNYRGAMPTPASIDILKTTYHVTTIISLVSKSQMSKKLQDSIKKSWLTWIVIPLTKYAPKSADWKKILTALWSWNVFVHCQHWADRTGAIIARAWVELENSTPDAAYKDMLTYNAKVETIKSYKEAFKYFKTFIYKGLL